MIKYKNGGFTLIELLVVISIIATLSTLILESLSKAKQRAIDAAAFSTGLSVNTNIVACDLDGGKVTVPNSQTNPTNDICTLGPKYGTWSKSPQNWVWDLTIWTAGEDNLIHLTPLYSGNNQYTGMYCGHYVEWSGYCPGPNTGLCRLSRGFSCTRLDSGPDLYK